MTRPNQSDELCGEDRTARSHRWQTRDPHSAAATDLRCFQRPLQAIRDQAQGQIEPQGTYPPLFDLWVVFLCAVGTEYEAIKLI